jgi:hypothetical protein
MQERFHNYNRPLLSFEENKRILGMLWPGRYCGFSGTIMGTNTITLTHGQGGIVETLLNQTVTLPKGVYVTRQGVVIKETDVIGPLPIASNASNAFKRIDTIVAEHEISQVAGGTAAIYSVIQGPDGEENPAPLTAPQKQIVLGYLEIPASAATTSGSIWKPALVPHTGGLFAAILSENNQFLNLNEFHSVIQPRIAISDGVEDWYGFGALGANTIINTNGPLSNTVGFLPKTKVGTFLFILNRATSGLTLQHTSNDSVGTELPGSILQNYASISTTTEAPIVIGPGGWALLLPTQDSPYGIYNVLMTSTEYNSLANLQSSLATLSSAVMGRVNRTVEAWKTVGAAGTGTAFGANFTPVAGRNPQFKKDDNNTVYLRGAVNWGTGGSNTIVFQLPSGYRPTQAMTFAQMVLDEVVSVTINTNGQVELFSPLGGVSAAPFQLSCQFRID